MKTRLLAITTLIACTALFSWMGCGPSETGQAGDSTGSLAGVVVLDGADDFSGTHITVGDQSRTTDEEGFYEFDRLSSGEVEVSASHDGFVSQTKIAEVVSGKETVLDFELGLESEPPVIDSVTVSPEVLVPEEQAQVIVDAHAPDGSTLSYDLSATGGFDVVIDEDDASRATLIAPDAFGVEAELSVTVTDESEKEAQKTVAVFTRDHDDPVIESVVAIPDVLEPGGVAALEVVASSPNDDELSYQWDAPESWNVVPTDEATAEVTAPDGVDEFATINVVVEDEFGGRAEDTVELYTSAGNAPEITALTVDPPQTEPGGEMELSVEANDPDGTDLSYQWGVSSEWTIVDGQQPQTTLVAPDEYGAVGYVTVEVSDEYGLSALATVIVSTIENQGPQIQSLIAVPVEVARGGLIDLEVSASHPQNADLSYDWTAPADWTLIEDPANPDSPQIEAPNQPGVTDLVEVVVTDPTGQEAVGSVMVRTLENQAPVIEALDASPAAAVPGQEQIVQASAYDPDGEALTFEWDVPDDWGGTSDTDELVLTAPDQYGVTDTVSLTVFDGYDTTTATVSVSTVQNIDPTISSLTASPAVVDRGATSELAISASHPYGEELSYEWVLDNADWTFSAGADTDDDTATLQAPDVSESETTATVTVTDDYGGIATASVVVMTAPNSPPVISSLSADPQIVDRQGTSTITIDAYDPDGEELEYAWSVDNADWIFDSGAGTGDDAATVEAPDVPESQVTVTVTVDDGHGGTTSSSVALTTAPAGSPVITGVDIDLDEWIARGGTADIFVDANHPDGDPLYYDWDVTGDWDIDGSMGADNEALLTAPDISDDNAIVEITVFDDWGSSDTYSFDVRTQDTEPDPFSYTDKTDVGPFQMVTSDAVEVTGFDGSVDAVCNDCEVGVNGGSFDTTASDIHSGDTIEIRRESGDLEETVTASVTVGDTTSEQWSITTTDWEGIREFTSCQQAGRTGPSQGQCDDEYDGTNLEGSVVLEEGMQIWTAPSSGTYRITAWGAQGGVGAGSEGGLGARMRGDFELDSGESLKILVGQQPPDRSGTASNDAGAGGGGTFVVLDADDSPLLVAGGGGAGGSSTNGADAVADVNGTAGIGSSSGAGGIDGGGGGGALDGVAGTSTEPGGTGSSCSYGSGGGGFYTRGGRNCSGSTPHIEGSSFLAGGLGGPADTGRGGVEGGFGGGAGVGHRAAGGGGWSGGGGDGNTHGGGGGGSYNDGTNQSNEDGANAGHGRVTIDFVTD